MLLSFNRYVIYMKCYSTACKNAFAKMHLLKCWFCWCPYMQKPLTVATVPVPIFLPLTEEGHILRPLFNNQAFEFTFL